MRWDAKGTSRRKPHGGVFAHSGAGSRSTGRLRRQERHRTAGKRPANGRRLSVGSTGHPVDRQMRCAAAGAARPCDRIRRLEQSVRHIGNANSGDLLALVHAGMFGNLALGRSVGVGTFPSAVDLVQQFPGAADNSRSASCRYPSTLGAKLDVHRQGGLRNTKRSKHVCGVVCPLFK